MCAMRNNTKIAVLGGSGFVGNALCARLATLGYGLCVLTRHADKCRHLRVLPALSIAEIKNYDSETIARHTADCKVVINLIGILNEKGRNGKHFHHTHVAITRHALRACEQNGARQLLQMSALNADPNGPSHYLRSKGKAENYLMTFSPANTHVTIFKPSVMFGRGDSFLNRFAGLLKTAPGVLPLACAQVKFAPVYVGDVVDHMVASIDNENSFGMSYPLCGPAQYSLKELVRYTANICGYGTKIISLPDSLSRLQARLFDYLPGKPFSTDNYNSLKFDSVCKQGICCPTPLEAIAPAYLDRRRSTSPA